MATFGLCGRQHKEQLDGNCKYSFSFPEGGVVVGGIPEVGIDFPGDDIGFVEVANDNCREEESGVRLSIAIKGSLEM
jgi:hypothetical protein